MMVHTNSEDRFVEGECGTNSDHSERAEAGEPIASEMPQQESQPPSLACGRSQGRLGVGGLLQGRSKL